MKRTNTATLITAALFCVATGTAFGQLTWTEDFAAGGDPDLNNWANGDVTDGQTWIIPIDESFGGPQYIAARRDSWPVTGAGPTENAGNGGLFGNSQGGRLRALKNSNVEMLAAIDLTSPIADGGTLDLINIGDGTGTTDWRIRLKDSGGTTALELVFGNAEDLTFMTGTQANSGPFITEAQSINWRNPGANLFISFDVLTDTFSVDVTETSGGNIAGTSGSFAFDNAVTEIARLEFVHDAVNWGNTLGGEVSFERIVLTQIPEPGALALIGIGALVAAFGRRTKRS
jgi:hypothetical protein